MNYIFYIVNSAHVTLINALLSQLLNITMCSSTSISRKLYELPINSKSAFFLFEITSSNGSVKQKVLSVLSIANNRRQSTDVTWSSKLIISLNEFK